MYEHCERIFGAKFQRVEIGENAPYKDVEACIFDWRGESLVLPKDACVKIELMGEHLSEVRD